MKNKEAKRWLEVCRPGGADAAASPFKEALQQARRNLALAGWFQEQHSFDSDFAKALGAVPVPADLRDSILAARKVVKPRYGREWRAHAALAASVVALAVAGGLLAEDKPEPFPQFRAELIEEAWDGQTHLEFESSDVYRVRQWLAGRNAVSDFSLPEGLQNSRIVGCRLVEIDGRRVPMLCLSEGLKHLHLFVVDGTQFAGLPPKGAPDFEKCGPWKTTTWQHGGRTYVLTGMKYQTFVNKFRKSGRWTMSS
jgi:hypothetical protein